MFKKNLLSTLLLLIFISANGQDDILLGKYVYDTIMVRKDLFDYLKPEMKPSNYSEKQKLLDEFMMKDIYDIYAQPIDSISFGDYYTLDKKGVIFTRGANNQNIKGQWNYDINKSYVRFQFSGNKSFRYFNIDSLSKGFIYFNQKDSILTPSDDHILIYKKVIR
ncbi:MAG: hypothetical protein ACKVOU_15240 [Cytophagales bacterium]